jgi:tol-pal system protein YbgF
MQGQLELQAHQMAQLQNSLSSATPSAAMPATAGIAPPVVAIPGNTVVPAAAPTAAMDANQAKAALNEEQEYQQAYQALLSKQYESARAGMQSYLQKYPEGSFAGNAHYWLGELDLISGDSTQALTEFTMVAEKFPNTAKAPDSMLKIGLIYADEQQYSKASKQLHNVVTRYPNSNTAELAKERLTLMQKQGNLTPADA